MTVSNLLPHLIVVILFLSITVNTWAQRPGGNGLLTITEQTILADPDSGVYTIQDILNDQLSEDFGELKDKLSPLSRSYQHWVKLQLRNDSDLPIVNLLQVGYATLDEVDAYLIQDNKVLSYQKAGDARPFYERTNLYLNNVIRLETLPKQDYTLYLHLKGKGNMHVPLQLYDVEVYHLATNITMFELGTGVGILLLVFSYSLVLVILTPHKVNIYFACYILFVLIFMICRSGAGSMYLWPGTPAVNDILMHAAVFFSITSSTLFSDRFLKVTLVSKNWSRLLRTVAVIAAILGILVLAGVSHTVMPRLSIVAMLYNIVILATGVMAFYRGEYNARIYAIGMFIFGLFCVLHVLSLYRIVSQSVFSFTFLRLGWYIEIIFLTIALTRSYVTTLKEKNRLNKLHERAARNMAIQKANINKVKEELDARNRQLLSKEMTGEEISEILNQLKIEIDQPILQKHIDRIEFLNSSKSNRWENFKVVFEQIHPDFFTRFQRQFPSLTQNDLRQLAYVKLNLTTKEIADLTNVSQQAVKIARNRLKKKLDTSLSLSDFISEFCQ